jgi:hypothetical protein
MMETLTYTLVADGSSDRCLEPIINWTLTRIPSLTDVLIDGQFADFREDPKAPHSLTERIRKAAQSFPYDVLFVHRDAEREEPADRREEIQEAVKEVGLKSAICIIPVRMTEAWLLIEEPAIRRAAGNPNGSRALNLPPLQRLESIPDPKETLHEALLAASESSGRRLKQFRRDLPMLKHRVSELIEDFSPLRRLSAFQQFERDVRAAFSTRAG